MSSLIASVVCPGLNGERLRPLGSSNTTLPGAPTVSALTDATPTMHDAGSVGTGLGILLSFRAGWLISRWVSAYVPCAQRDIRECDGLRNRQNSVRIEYPVRRIRKLGEPQLQRLRSEDLLWHAGRRRSREPAVERHARRARSVPSPPGSARRPPPETPSRNSADLGCIRRCRARSLRQRSGMGRSAHVLSCSIAPLRPRNL